jgi:hypothetical protein
MESFQHRFQLDLQLLQSIDLLNVVLGLRFLAKPKARGATREDSRKAFIVNIKKWLPVRKKQQITKEGRGGERAAHTVRSTNSS